MILSNLLFPSSDICQEVELYYSGYGYIYQNNSIAFKANGLINTATYFNSFSLDKWKKYTKIGNVSIELQLSGEFNISLFSMKFEQEKLKRKLLSTTYFKEENRTKIEHNYDINADGMIYFQLESLTDGSIFYGGSYKTAINETELNSVKLAIGICTFKREQYVTSNINRLNERITDKTSPLFNNVDVFVSDNGQSLPIDELSTNHIHIYKNKNLGGAGGFTRCLIEAKNLCAVGNYTNFIFMDDDIVLDVAAIEKNFTLLSLLKPEHKKSLIGGAMFSTDEQFLQFENAAKWQRTGFVFNKRNTDMRIVNNVVKNEMPFDANYNAWCYCCIPFDIVTNDNLPLPIFFHMDDIEYCLRNKLPVITLNGINVWHLYKKELYNAKNDYYDIRNRLIMLSELNPKDASTLAYIYLKSFLSEALKYHYARAINAFNGIIDFCKGFDYFKNLDTLEKHKSLYNNVKWVPANKEIEDKAQIGSKDLDRKKSKIVTLIFTLLPAMKKHKVVYSDNGMLDTRGVKTICAYNHKEKMCIEYKKSLRLAFICFLKWMKAKHLLKNKLADVVAEFNHRLTEVQHIDFWNDYLDLPSAKKMKVLFAASDNDATSGAFRSMVFLNQQLMENGVDTCVLLPKDGNGLDLLKKYHIRHTIINSEDWVRRLDASNKEIFSKRKNMYRNKKSIKKVTRFLKTEKFDLVHINTTYHYVAALAAKKLQIPVAWHLREFLEEDQKRRILDKRFGYKLINKSAKIIAISNSLHNKYINVFDSDRLVTIFNGISMDDFYNKNKTIFNENKKLIFICVGFIADYKGQKLLVEACGKLKKRHNIDFEVWLAGKKTEDYAKEIERVITDYRLDNRVKFLGQRTDVNKLYEQADIAFMCSRSEAFGRVTVEAMMSGCLLIGTNSACTREIVKDGENGLLYEADNSDDLYEKIWYALQNKQRMQTLAANGRTTAITKYSSKTNADNIHSLYEQILQGGNSK